MIRGVRFQIPNQYGNFFAEIFQRFQIERYFVYVSGPESEIYKTGPEDLFDITIYSGKDFLDTVNSSDHYLPYFAKIMVSRKSNLDYSQIHNFGDLANSDFDLVLICIDAIFVEIYTKHADVAAQFSTTAQEWNYSDIEFITETNDNNIEFEAL